ncbi:MAG: hypothetical protein ABI867_27440 [Kofleriaceae bacterium]
MRPVTLSTLALLAACTAGDRESSSDQAISTPPGPPPVHACEAHLGAKPWEGNAGGFQPCTGNLALELPAGPVALAYNSRGGLRLALRDRLVRGADGSVTRELGDGERVVYTPRPGGGFDTPSDALSSLEQVDDNTYVLRFPGNTRHTYTRGTTGALVLTTMRDRLGNATTYSYDAADREVAMTDAVGNRTTLTWASDRLAAVGDAEGTTWMLDYDAANQLIAIRGPAGSETFGYDAAHQLVEWRSATGTLIARYAYHADGSLDAWSEASGRRTSVSYGGDEVRIVDPFGDTTTYRYASGHLAELVDASGIATRNAYDARDRIVTTTDWLGAITAYEYDARDNVTRVTDRYGKTTTYTYDDRHNVLATTDAAGKTTTYTYDANDLVRTIVDPAGRLEQYQRAANGNLLEVIGSDGKRFAAYSYGPRGEVLEERDQDDRTTRYTYDGFLNLTSVTDGDGIVTRYTSSPLGRPLSTTSHAGEERVWMYDAARRLIGIRYEDASDAAFARDADGRLVGATSTLAGTPRAWSGAYTPDGRIATTTVNGIVDQAAPSVLNIPAATQTTLATRMEE